MKTYTATSQNSRNFILENENQEILGELIYPKWYSTKAEIHIGSKIFKTDTKGFFKYWLMIGNGASNRPEFDKYKRYYLSLHFSFTNELVMTVGGDYNTRAKTEYSLFPGRQY